MDRGNRLSEVLTSSGMLLGVPAPYSDENRTTNMNEWRSYKPIKPLILQSSMRKVTGLHILKNKGFIGPKGRTEQKMTYFENEHDALLFSILPDKVGRHSHKGILNHGGM